MVKIKCSTQTYKTLTDTEEKVKLNLMKSSPLGYMWKDKYDDKWRDIDTDSPTYFFYDIVCENK